MAVTMTLTLRAVARCPFLPADDLALFTGTGSRAARARLLRLHRAGLVDCIHVPETHLHLYYLTLAGITAAARAAGTSPAMLAARYGLGDRALQRRLPAMERLLAGRRVLIALQQALRTHGGLLEEWRAWPVRWSASRGTRRRALSLDGDGTIRLPGPHPDSDRQPFGFLWDGDEGVPPTVLAEYLACMDWLATSAADDPDATRLPPVLLVTVAPERVPAGYRPGLLWTTWAEIARRGLLNAPWRESSPRGTGGPLLDALTALGPAPVRPPTGAVQRPGHSRECARSARLDPPPRFQQRVEALRRGTTRAASLPLLALAIPPRGIEILQALGMHPLLTAPDVAIACALNASHIGEVLDLLRCHGLIAAWMLPGDRRACRHVLTARGVRLLAARSGVAPDTYRRLYGALDHATGRRRRALWFACRNLNHTDGLNRTYLALLAATRACGGDLVWRGEWACITRYPDGPRRGLLKPDAEVLYTGPGDRRRLFVELDRGTMRLPRLGAKLARYGAYRAGVGRDQVTVLLVTTGYERGWEALHLNESLPRIKRMPPLDLVVTTDGEIAERGAGARLWRGTFGPCTTLDAYFRATTGPAPLMPPGSQRDDTITYDAGNAADAPKQRFTPSRQDQVDLARRAEVAHG